MIKKRLLILLTMTLFGTGIVQGQAALLVLIFGDKVASENFYFSLKMGGTYADISGYEEGKNALAFNFGLVNNIKLNDRLFLTPEFLPAASKGIKEVPLLTTGDASLDALLVEPNSSNRKLSYIDVPVLLKILISDRFAISAGPSFSFLTGASDTYQSSPIDGTVLTSDLDIKSLVSGFDVAGTIDLSFAISKAREGKGLNLYIRYSKGFIDILKNNPGDPFTHSTFQFGATFPFIEE